MYKEVVADDCRYHPRPVHAQAIARRQHVARGDIYREKASFNPLPGKAEMENGSGCENS